MKKNKGVLNSTATQSEFDVVFAKFDKYYETLLNHATTEATNKVVKNGKNGKIDGVKFDNFLPRSLRLFNISLRITIGLEISFNTDYARTKSKTVKKAYTALLKCNQSWFSHEAMCTMADGTKPDLKWSLIKDNRGKIEKTSPFDAKQIAKFNIDKILQICNDQIKNQLCSKNTPRKNNSTIYKDIIEYLEFLKASARPGLKNNLAAALTEFKKGSPLKLEELLAILYATRNISVHAGESAKSGSTENNPDMYIAKIKFLRILYDFSVLFQLYVITHAVETICKEKQIPLVP